MTSRDNHSTCHGHGGAMLCEFFHLEASFDRLDVSGSDQTPTCYIIYIIQEYISISDIMLSNPNRMYQSMKVSQIPQADCYRLSPGPVLLNFGHGPTKGFKKWRVCVVAHGECVLLHSCRFLSIRESHGGSFTAVQDIQPLRMSTYNGK